MDALEKPSTKSLGPLKKGSEQFSGALKRHVFKKICPRKPYDNAMDALN